MPKKSPPTDAEVDARETAYEQGSRMAWASMLNECLRHLGYDSPAAMRTRWIAERELAIHQLRSLCAEFGDNDWPDNLNLGDVIDKHLGDHLRR